MKRHYLRRIVHLFFVISAVLALVFQHSAPQAEAAAALADFTYNGTTGQDGSIQTYAVTATGKYIIETWGASGGNSADGLYNGNVGGAGGYSVGVASLTAGQVLEIVVGGKGGDSPVRTGSGICPGGAGGFGAGGGGGGAWCGGNATGGGGGGGLSLVRIQGSATLIIAGAGGGAGGGSSSISSVTATSNCHGAGGAGGAGGGNTGAQGASSPSAACTSGGRGGTQSSGGANGADSMTAARDDGSPGGAFFGGYGGGGAVNMTNGNGTTFVGGTAGPGSTSSSAGGSGGGGGGYYGGGGGGQRSSGGGGGSGYIGGVTSDAGLSITAQTLGGTSVIPNPNGGTITGNIGNGYVRITPTCTTICIESVTPTQGSIGGGNTLTITGKGFAAGAVVTIDYAGTAANCTNVVVAGNGESLTCVAPSHVAGPVGIKVENQINTVTSFSTCGSTTNYTAQLAGNYVLETWGAQGGMGRGSIAGGNGGYSAGTVTLSAGDSLFINIGCKGTDGTALSGATNNTTPIAVPGGWNGGGNGYGGGTSIRNDTSGSGGGATDIRIGTNSLKSRVIVAGGGAGGTGSLSTTPASGVGGGAAGTAGGAATDGATGAGGGTISAGGAASTGYTVDSGLLLSPTAGSFGQGGNGAAWNSSSYIYGGGGGGGGWYGGGGANARNNSAIHGAGAGGGSGWLYTAANYSTWSAAAPSDASGWLLSSSYYLSSATTIAGNAALPNPAGSGTVVGRAGNGYARITAPAPSDTYATCENCYLYVAVSIQLTIPTIQVSLSMSNSTPYNYGSSDIRVTTNNPTGYKLYIHANGSVDATRPQDVVCLDDSQYRFTPTTSGTLASKTWGIQIGTTVNSSNWLTPTVADIEFPGSNTATGPASDGASYNTHKLWVGAKTDGSLPACVYDSSLLVTAVTNNP
jgi:hypothetical protein